MIFSLETNYQQNYHYQYNYNICKHFVSRAIPIWFMLGFGFIADKFIILACIKSCSIVQ